MHKIITFIHFYYLAQNLHKNGTSFRIIYSKTPGNYDSLFFLFQKNAHFKLNAEFNLKFQAFTSPEKKGSLRQLQLTS